MPARNRCEGHWLGWPTGARFHAWVWERHLRLEHVYGKGHKHHHGDYEVCRHWLCELAWRLERWLWWGLPPVGKWYRKGEQ